jgi:CIC family chloride channel protein
MGQSSRPRPWRTSQPELPVHGFLGRLSRNERIATLLGSVLVGVCGGLAAMAFRYLVEGSFQLFARASSMTSGVHAAVVVGLPACGGLVVGLMSRGRETSAGEYGMGGIRAAFITTGGVLRTRLALLRALSCAITTGSGGSAGCEGPVARVAGAVGSWLARRLGLHPSRMQVLVACGVSASLAGLLHTPIAAVVFATEVILGGYAIRSLAPLVVSAVTAMAITRYVGGNGPALDVSPFVLLGPKDLVVHLLLGLACGAVAAGFIHLLDRCQTLNLRVPLVLQPALGGLLVGVLALAAPGILGVGYPVVGALFRGDMTLTVVAVLVAAKLVATTVTLGTRGVGGVFAPSLLFGSALGWLVGHGANRAFPGAFAPPATFAAAGMAAMVAGVTHAPFTGAVLLVECTRSYQAVLPGVVAALAASMLSTSLHDESAYGLGPDKKAPEEPSEPHTTTLRSSTIQDLLDPWQDTVPATISAREFLRRLPMARSPVLVVAHEGRVMGIVSVRKASEQDPSQLSDQPVTALMADTGTLQLEDSVARAVVQFMDHDEPAMPVVAATGELIGLVWRSDLMDYCAHDLLQEYVHFGNAAFPPPGVPEARPLRHDVAALPVPRIMVGRTLRDVDLGKQFGIVCVGLRRATESGKFVAAPLSPSLVLRAEDVLILTGNAPDLQRLSELEDDGTPSTGKGL